MTEQTQLTFLGRSFGLAFVRRTVTIPPQTSLACADAEWRGELVVIERGEIELESRDGDRHLFPKGSVLTLSGLQLRALHNSGTIDAVLVAVSRNSEKTRDFSRETDQFPVSPSSQ